MFTDIVDLFFSNAKKYAKKTSIIELNYSLTYAQFLEKVQQIAYKIILHAQHNHPRVLILLDKGSDAYASMFATLLVGGFYCPVNISIPEFRLKSIIEKFDPEIILYKKTSLITNLKNFSNIKFLDLSKLTNDKFIEKKKPHKLAYVIFTSGTTGEPKGVMIKRISLLNYVTWAKKFMNISAKDRWSQQPSIGFDLSVLDIYASLCFGSTLFPLIDEKDMLFPTRFINKNKLTIWNSVPSVIDVMSTDYNWKKGALDTLRLFTFCGEPLYQTHLEKIFKIHPRVKIQNTYGPTEATVSCTAIKLTKKNYLKKIDKSVSLGLPIQNMNLIINNKIQRGSLGEIFLSGIQLSEGYWKNYNLTKKFFKRIIINKRKIRIYKTGDLGQVKKGLLYFIGRADNQLKIRGYRIELESIDFIISKINESSVCTIFNNKQLHCFLEKGKYTNPNDLKKQLNLYLTDYEIPKYYYFKFKLPRNQNNKIDRKKLSNYIKVI
jgi:D-alanine--poly(phosphoribitol) ligase subunit 1